MIYCQLQTRMTWLQDPNFWTALDDLCDAAWTPLLDFLNVLNEHTDAMPLQAQAFIFGGLGKFVGTYQGSRAELNNHENSFFMAMNAVANDRRMMKLHEMAGNQMVDNAVDKFKGVNE